MAYFSTALGSNATASGNFSTAAGACSTASGYGSAAFGYLANASGNYSQAFGYQATASATNSTAIGRNAASTRADQIALGTNTTEVTVPNLEGTGNEVIYANSDGTLIRSSVNIASLAQYLPQIARRMEQKLHAMETHPMLLATIPQHWAIQPTAQVSLPLL